MKEELKRGGNERSWRRIKDAFVRLDGWTKRKLRGEHGFPQQGIAIQGAEDC